MILSSMCADCQRKQSISYSPREPNDVTFLTERSNGTFQIRLLHQQIIRVRGKKSREVLSLPAATVLFKCLLEKVGFSFAVFVQFLQENKQFITEFDKKGLIC
jgi:hypothetical protein